MEKPRSLYQCFHAKVMGDKIYCEKGHLLTCQNSGCVSIQRLANGQPLEMDICQNCPDYDKMGEPLAKNQRGWNKNKTQEKQR